MVSVGVFDIFRKEVRSISFRVVFQSYEDTLTDESVNESAADHHRQTYRRQKG